MTPSPTADVAPVADRTEPDTPAGPVGRRYDAVVVGGGVIGLSAAWLAARRGLVVVVVDPAPGRGASWVAAGMLAPVTEVHYGEEALLALTLAAARAWPAFADELTGQTGLPIGYERCGTLLVAWDEGDRAWAEELYRFQRELALDVEWLTSRRARNLEPELAPGIRAGVWAADDHQVHNRMLVTALLEATAQTGVEIQRRSVTAVETSGGAVAGVVLDDGTILEAGAVVVAAGCHSSSLGGLPDGALPAIRPVKGQILRLRPTAAAPRLGHTVRGVVEGSSVYLVPRADGSLVVGATMEEQGFDTSVTAGAVYELLRDARRVVPGVTEMTLGEASAGLRPGSSDNGPVVGLVDRVPGLVLATGHHRNGILLAPLTAAAVAALLCGDEPPVPMAPFGPGRFTEWPR